MKVFAQKMAELFAHDLPFNVDGNYPATIKLDTACRFACHLLGASSTSLLLYSGSDDKLFCRGRYINSRNIFQPSQPNRELREMLKYICVYNFIYRARSINKRVNADALFDDYKKSILKGGDISKTNFGKIFEDYHKWEKPYGKYRAVVGNEYYKVDKSTLTGGFYKKLLGLEPEYKMEMVVQDIRQLQNEKKYYCINPLRDKLKLTFYSKYYVALPLFANGHYFGVLRFLFPHNTGIFDHAADNQLLVKDEYKKQFQYIAQIVSLHLENFYILMGYNRTYFSSKKHVENFQSLNLFLNNQCEKLSAIIESRGAIIRMWDNTLSMSTIAGYSPRLEKLIQFVTDEKLEYFEGFIKKFQERKNILAVHFNCNTFPFEAIQYIGHEDKDFMSCRFSQWRMEKLSKSKILGKLKELGISNIAILPIPNIPKGYITFMNSRNRNFLNKDIEMVYPAVRNLGLELGAYYYTERIANRMKVISRMHEQISGVIAAENIGGSLHVREFLRILAEAIDGLGIFSHHITWEYVSEEVPQGFERDDIFFFRNITHNDYDDVPFTHRHTYDTNESKGGRTESRKSKEAQEGAGKSPKDLFEMGKTPVTKDLFTKKELSVHKEHARAGETKSQKEYAKAVNTGHMEFSPPKRKEGYRKNDIYEIKGKDAPGTWSSKNFLGGEELKPIFKLDLQPDYSYFDLPFYNYNVAETEEPRIVGVFTLIYRRAHRRFVNDREFIEFMHFFSRQISIAWEKLQESIAEKILRKIDARIRSNRRQGFTSRRRDLTEIAKILADDFGSHLCCFFLSNENETSLDLTACNIPIRQKLYYGLAEDGNSLSVRSYVENCNFRIFGRQRVEQIADTDKLKQIEKEIKHPMLRLFKERWGDVFRFDEICIEHWQSQVIAFGENAVGLIKLFQVKGLTGSDDADKYRYATHPFSEFEPHLLARIQKHIFNVVITHKTIRQRIEDMRNVLHQVVAPLNALGTQCTNLEKGIVPPEKLHDKYTYLKIQARVASRYARNFQKILDIDTGNIALNMGVIPNLRKYLIDKAIDFQALAAEKGISIHVIGESRSNVSLSVDVDLFEHVISNLLDNAVKYSYDEDERFGIGLKRTLSSLEQDGNISVSARERDDSVVIIVSNWGLDITAEERAEIYKREFRGERARDYAPTGTGIGLFLAKEIVRMHGGTLELLTDTHRNNIKFRIKFVKDKRQS